MEYIFYKQPIESDNSFMHSGTDDNSCDNISKVSYNSGAEQKIVS